MAQEPGCRAFGAPQGEQRYQRRKREERETDVWIRQVHATRTPEPGSMWVHVGDPRADMFPFFQACRSTQTHFLVRAAQNRRVQQDEDEISYALAAGTSLSERGEPSVRGSCQAWSLWAFDAAPACLWADDALATARTRREQARTK